MCLMNILERVCPGISMLCLGCNDVVVAMGSVFWASATWVKGERVLVVWNTKYGQKWCRLLMSLLRTICIEYEMSFGPQVSQ
jgi:hypothetical protein